MSKIHYLILQILKKFLKRKLEQLGYPTKTDEEGKPIKLEERFSDFNTPTFEDQFKHTPKANVLLTLKVRLAFNI